MNKEQIIQMAREAGLIFNEEYGTDLAVKMYRERVERFATAIIAAVKDEDAKICEELSQSHGTATKECSKVNCDYMAAWSDASDAIRASK